MKEEGGSSEIIGVILLIGIIMGSFGIFAGLYLPTIKPVIVPQVKLSMACSDITTNDVEYPCTRGSSSCSSFDNRSCEEDCRYRDYSDNPQFNSESLKTKILRCMENCGGSLCSDLKDCNALYICHNGGDALQISTMTIVVNGKVIDQNRWEIKKGDADFHSLSSNLSYTIGDTLRINKETSYSTPVDTVTIISKTLSGGNITLAMNQFGTDVSNT